MNVFKEMGCSIAKPSAYPKFLKNKRGKIFGYGMLLMLFYFLLSAVLPLVFFQIRTGGFGTLVGEAVPDFEVTDQGFWIEEPVLYEAAGSYIELDSDYYFDEEAAYEFSRGYQSMLLVDREKLIVKSNGQVQTLYFYMLESGTYFSKEMIMAMIPMIYLFLILGLIFYFIMITALFFFGVLIVSLVGMLLNMILNAQLSFGEIFIIALYGRTMPLFFKGLILRFLSWTIFPITIPYFWVINFGVTLVYMFLAMKRIGAERSQPVQYVYQQPYSSDPYQQGGYGQSTYQQNSYGSSYQNQNGYPQPTGSQSQENSQTEDEKR